MNHCTCLVVGALCMFKWLPCFALLRRKSGNACCNHFFLQKNSGHALPCGSSSSHALNYSLSPTCGTTSIGVHQPCTKLLRSRVTVDYPDRSAAVMPNEPSNHNPLSSFSSKLDGRSGNISLGLNPLLPRLLVQRKPPLGDCIGFSHGEPGTNSSSIPDKSKSLGRR